MVEYEWVVETLEAPGDDDASILEVNHWPTYTEAKAFAASLQHYDIGIVRDSWSGGYLDRSWAYVRDGKLPEYFSNAFGVRVCAVPKRFHKEVPA